MGGGLGDGSVEPGTLDQGASGSATAPTKTEPQQLSACNTSSPAFSPSIDSVAPASVLQPVSSGLSADGLNSEASKGKKKIRKDGAKGEKVPSPWKVEDYLRSEEWFRDVVGLPGIGIVPTPQTEVAPGVMDEFFGAKKEAGYPWKADSCKLSTAQREEVLHLLHCTDGRAIVQNDYILVGFAKGYYLMRKEGKAVNWARFAANKHKGQLEGMVRRGEQEPVPGSGIRDETVKYRPFMIDETVSPSLADAEAKSGDIMVENSGKGVGETAHGETAEYFPFSTTPDSKRSGTNLDRDFFHCPSVPSSPGLSLRPKSARVASRELSSVRAFEERYGLLADYLKVTHAEIAKCVGQKKEHAEKIEKCRCDLLKFEDAKKEAAAAISSSKKQCVEFGGEISALVARLGFLKADKSHVSNEIDTLYEKIAEGQADGCEEDYLEECAKELSVLQGKLRDLEKDIAVKFGAVQDLEKRKRDAQDEEGRLHQSIARIIEEENSCKTQSVCSDLALKDAESNMGYFKKFESEYLNLQRAVESTYTTPLAVAMVPSPSKTRSILFRITNCPICEFGFECDNFLPVSCGHAYHPACGLPYFHSQSEPRCKACNKLLQMSWLKTWGVQPGPGNLSEGMVDSHEDLITGLRREDLSLRTDHGAYHQLQEENKAMRLAVTRAYTQASDGVKLGTTTLSQASLAAEYRLSGDLADDIPVTDFGEAKGHLVKKESQVSQEEDEDVDIDDDLQILSDDGSSGSEHKSESLKRPDRRSGRTVTRSQNGIQKASKKRGLSSASKPPVSASKPVPPKMKRRRESGGTSSTLATDNTPEGITVNVKSLDDVRTPRAGTAKKSSKCLGFNASQ